MPIYEYACDACGERTEVIQKVSDDPLTDCPQCGRPALRKLVSAAGFRLKGGGWYETDFKGGKKRNVTEGESSKASGGSDSKSKGDAKAGASSGSADKASSA